jgi:hypothetical protein
MEIALENKLFYFYILPKRFHSREQDDFSDRFGYGGM